MSAENVDEVLIRLAQYASIPSVWIFKDTELCIGDMRLLAEEVQDLRAKLAMKHRDDLLRVTVALRQTTPIAVASDVLVERAAELIAAIDNFEFNKQEDESTRSRLLGPGSPPPLRSE